MNSTKNPNTSRRNLFTVFKRFFRKNGQAQRSSSELAMNQVLRVKNVKGLPSGNQLKHLPKILNQKEKIIASVALIGVIVTGILLGNELLADQRITVPAVGGSYTEGLIGSPQLVNPIYAAKSDVDTDLSRLIYSGLMRMDDEQGLQPDLAESYTISEDQKEYTFILREDVEWHDGKSFRAADVIFTMNAIQIPEYLSPLEVSFSGIEVQQIDERTVKFILDEPFAPFLSMLTVGILPSHLWEEIQPINAVTAELNKKPVGTGPYEFEKLVKDTKGTIRSYTLKRNEDFYRGAPYIDEINFKFYPDLSAGIEALKNGNVEALSYVPAESLETFERNNSVQLAFAPLQQYTAAFINLKSENAVKDLKVREALSLGANKEDIIDTVLKGHGAPIYSFILPGMVGENPELPKYVYDLEGARTKLQEAGWELIENSPIRQKDGTPLTVKLVTLNATELVQVAEALKEQWAQLGVDTQITSVNSTDFQSSVLKNREYDILLSGELYGAEPDPYAFWHSSQATYPGLNLTQFANRKADEQIEIGRNTTDLEKRAEAYKTLQTEVIKQVPAIFLYQPDYAFAVPKRIQNIDVDRLVIPADRFNEINEWYIKTRKIFGVLTPEEPETESIEETPDTTEETTDTPTEETTEESTTEETTPTP